MVFVPILSSTAPRRSTSEHGSTVSLCFTSEGTQIVVAASLDQSSVGRVFYAEDVRDTGDFPAIALHVATPHRSNGSSNDDDGCVLCVAVCPVSGLVAVGLASAHALLLTNSLAFDKTLCRLSTPIHAVAFRPRNSSLLRQVPQVAVAGEDAEIRIVNTVDIKDTIVLKGHNDTIKSLAFSADGDFLASVDTLGDLHIWDLRPQKPISLRVLRSVLPATNVDLKDMGRISWHPSGKYLAIPGIHKDINILDTKTWTSYKSLTGHSKLVTAVKYSHDGSILASTDQAGKMYFWNGNGKEKMPYNTIKNPSIVTDFCWHPTKNDICLAIDTCEMEYLQDVAPPAAAEANPPTKASEKSRDLDIDFDSLTDYPSKDSSKKLSSKSKMDLDDFPFDDDVDEFNAAGGDDDFVVDDDGMGYADPIESFGDAKRYYSKQVKGSLSSSMAAKSSGFGMLMATAAGAASSGVGIQDCFQPGATSMKGNKRYLAFNLLGTIHVTTQSSQTVIHISHHDKSHRDYSFQDHHSYTMASLTSRGAVFASDPASPIHADSTSPVSLTHSIVEFKPFENWGTSAGGPNGGWQIPFNPTENVKAVCMTSRTIVVATDLRYLRFISYGGVQTDIWCLEGPVVALSAASNVVGGGGSDGAEFVAVLYHEAGTFHGDQCLGYMLLSIGASGVVKGVRKGRVPVSPGSTVVWCGFSDSNMFATYDSSGVMRLLSPYDDFGCSWRPVFDGRIAREGKQLWYWPIGVTETQLMCVICKSGDKQPFPPKSIISDIDLKVPVLNGEGLSSVEEESLLRQRLMATHQLARAHATGEPISKEREMKVKLFGDIDRSVIKQILAACKQEKTQKVLELTHQLTSVKAIDGAMKCAVSYKLSGVANKINQIKEAFIKKEEEAAMKMRQVRAIAHPAVPPVAVKTEAVVVAPAAEPAKKHVPVDTPRPAASIPDEPEADAVQAESSMDTFSNAFEDDPVPEVPASAGKRKGIFGAVKLEPGLKAPPVFGGGAAKKAKNAANSGVDEVAPVARVKNPFAANTAPTASASVKAASKTGTVGGLFQDLKESNDSKAVATTKSTKEEQPASKVKKQESLLGFFKKGPIKAPSASTETSPVKTEAPAQPDEDEMQLDAALDMLKAATGDEVKENESQIPIRTWEEKGKARAEGGELERQSSF